MPEYMPLLLFGSLFILLMFGFPVAFTLGGVSLFFGYLTFGFNLFNLLPLRIWGVMTNYVLIAVPLFIYMGVMLEKSGLAEELLETMGLLFGRLSGGLAFSVLVVGALLAASTGIVGATVVTMGLLSLPTMLKRGYSPRLATGTVAAAGTLGQIIPPSIVLVLLGSILNVSIGEIFMGAVVPGLILVTLYFVWIVIVALKRPDLAPSLPEEELRLFREKGMGKRVLRALILPLFLICCCTGFDLCRYRLAYRGGGSGGPRRNDTDHCTGEGSTTSEIQGGHGRYNPPHLHGIHHPRRCNRLWTGLPGDGG